MVAWAAKSSKISRDKWRALVPESIEALLPENEAERKESQQYREWQSFSVIPRGQVTHSYPQSPKQKQIHLCIRHAITCHTVQPGGLGVMLFMTDHGVIDQLARDCHGLQSRCEQVGY